MNLVEIFIMGKKYDVPSDLTIQKAIEFAGFQIIRGCGCRGGVCGACATIYRTPGDFKIKSALACTTLVEAGMELFNLPYFPSRKAIYDIEDLSPTDGTIVKLYPEIARCVGCNNCTKMCPQNVPVMEAVAAALRGDIEKAAKSSVECVMCGLCSARCTGELQPNYILLLCRRLYGRYRLLPYPHVINRLKQIDSGQYNDEMERLAKLSVEELREEYKKAQADKRVI